MKPNAKDKSFTQQVAIHRSREFAKERRSMDSTELPGPGRLRGVLSDSPRDRSCASSSTTGQNILDTSETETEPAVIDLSQAFDESQCRRRHKGSPNAHESTDSREQ